MSKRTKKKNGKKRTVARRRRPVLSGFPTSKMVKLRYIDSDITLDAAAGLTADYVFRANSVFDPDYTGTGHQPMGRDQWSEVYNRYTVLGSKITLYATPIATTNSVPTYFGITLSGETSPLGSYSSINSILESKLSSGTRLAGSTVSGAIPRSLKLTKTFSAKKFFGVKDVQDGAALSAEVGANPSKDAYFSVWAASVDGSNPGAMSFRVQIDYIVLYREPKNLDGS